MDKNKVGPLGIVSLVRDLRRGAGDRRPLAVVGEPAQVAALAAALREGGDPAAVVEQDVDGTAVDAWVATDRPLVEVLPSLAKRLGDDGPALAARLPVLRAAVCDELIRRAAPHNAIVAAAVFVPGVDLPILTLNQARLVLQIAIAHGVQLDRDRAVELLGVVGAGFGLRAAARELLDFVPIAGWIVKGSVAYSGTRAVGEAALRYFAARATSGPGPTLPETDGR